MDSVVSIIIPTYKPDVLLKDCLNSISNQTYKDYELVIILNGCNEPYYTKIQDWIKECDLVERTKLIQIDVAGVSNARNIGIEQSNGTYITFIDDDDLISHNYLAQLVNCIRNDNTLGVSNVALYPIENNQDIQYKPSLVFDRISKHGNLNLYESRQLLNGPWMKLFPRKMIGETRFDNKLSLGEDALFLFEISKRINQINVTSSNTYYYYRLIDGGVSWKNRSVAMLFTHMCYLLRKYSKVYMSAPSDYDFRFYLNRIFALTYSFSIAIIRRVVGGKY